MSATKAMTLRLDAELAEELEIVAEVEQQPMAAVVRTAVANYLRNRKADHVKDVTGSGHPRPDRRRDRLPALRRPSR